MAITNLYNDLVLDVYDHDQTQSTIKAIALDDNSRYVRAQLTYDENPYTAPQNAAVTLTVIRPDKVGVAITGSTYAYDINTGGEYDPETGEEITPSTDETYYGVTAELDQVALAKAGVCLAQFKIVDGTQTLRTEIFKINNGRALDADTVEWAGSIDGYNLDEMANRIDTIELLQEGLAGDISELKEGLTDVGAVLHYKSPTIIDGKTVTTTGTTANPTSFNTESGWSCAVDDCKPGEVYTISGHGGAKTRLWCFIDEDNNILAAADIGKTVDDLRLVVPPKAVKIICNFQPSANTVKLTKIMGVFYTDYELKNRNAAADALRVGEEVELINDHLSQLRTNEVSGKVDALLGARWSLNHISTDNGQDKNNGYNCRTDNYIQVADADGYLHYKMSSPSGIRMFLFFYNSAKEWISHDAGSLHTGTYEGQVALPAGTAYIRFLLSNEDWGMFDTISDATDYFDAWFVPEAGEEKKFETIYGARIEEAAKNYEADAAVARLGYIWISDLHFKKNWTDNTTALKRQLKAVARLANRTSIDFVCIGGDIIDAESEADDLFENINYWLSPLAECNKPVIYLIGNHDDNAYGEWIGKLPAKGLFVDRGEYHNDICTPTSDAGYFYFDIDRKGVRVVCLDTIDYESRSGKNGSNWWSLSQSQVEWFCQKALDTPYDIVILSHMTPDYDYNSWHLGNEGGYHSDLISAIAAYNARGTVTLYSKTLDFTEAEGYIKMMHVGHAHFEFEAAKTVGGIPCIFTSCAKQYGQAQQSYETAVTGKDDTYTIASSVAYDTHHQNTTGYEYKRYTTRTLYTISEALFDLVSVKNTRADFYRIGAGEDRQVTLQATNPRKYDDQRFRIPKAPTTTGTYILKVTVSGGTPTYTWESEATS